MSIECAVSAFQVLSPKWDDAERKLDAEFVLSQETLDALMQAITCSIANELITPIASRRARRVDAEKLSASDFGKSYRVEFLLDEKIKIYRTFDELVKCHPIEPPNSFLLTSEPEGIIYYPCNGPTGKLKHYFEAQKIWKYLLKKADDNSVGSLTFLYRKKLNITNKYSADDLVNGFDGLAKFISLIDSDEKHEREKAHILQNTLISMLINIDDNDRFSYLLRHFSKFSLRFDEAYQAYVVGFSFDELRKEYEEKYRDYMVKINDLISGSLTKSLAIPATIFLVTTRTQAIATAKNNVSLSEAMTTNIGIMLVTIFVSLAFTFMIINELHSLTSIKTEYSSLMGRLEDKSAEAFLAIKDFKKHLGNRLTYAKVVFITLIVLAVINLVTSALWVACRTFC